MSQLKKYKVVHAEGVSRIVHSKGIIVLSELTDEQAEILFNSGCRYIEKVSSGEAINTPTKKPKNG